jgi:hypothetical protein
MDGGIAANVLRCTKLNQAAIRCRIARQRVRNFSPTGCP